MDDPAHYLRRLTIASHGHTLTNEDRAAFGAAADLLDAIRDLAIALYGTAGDPCDDVRRMAADAAKGVELRVDTPKVRAKLVWKQGVVGLFADGPSEDHVYGLIQRQRGGEWLAFGSIFRTYPTLDAAKAACQAHADALVADMVEAG